MPRPVVKMPRHVYYIAKQKTNPHLPHLPHLAPALLACKTRTQGVRGAGGEGSFWLITPSYARVCARYGFQVKLLEFFLDFVVEGGACQLAGGDATVTVGNDDIRDGKEA